MVERLTPERSVRLLRAKAAELENIFKEGMAGELTKTGQLAADIALIAALLADHIEDNIIQPLDIDDANVRDMREGR